MNRRDGGNNPLRPIRVWGTGIVSRSWLQRAEAIFTAIIAYLLASPLLARWAGHDAPAGRLLVLSHDSVGATLLVVLPVFVLVHVVGRAGLRPRALEAGLSCLKRMAFVVLVLFVTVLACQLTPVLGIAVLLSAVWIFEWAERDRRRSARLVDASLTALYVVIIAITPQAKLVRMTLVAGILLVECQAIAFVRNVIRQEGESMSPWGMLSIGFAAALLPFSIILHINPVAAAYGKAFSIYAFLHIVTTAGFGVALVAHIIAVAKKGTATRRASNVFSVPAFVAGLVAIVAWQLGATTVLQYRHSPPPAIDAASLTPRRVSAYTRVQGYTQFAWDERVVQAESCSRVKCHAEVTEQHELSAHGRAFTNDAFQYQLAQFIREKGREAADYCIACHAPLGVIAHPGGTAGALSLDAMTKNPLFATGITCVVCHRSTPETHRDRMGNASLIIRPLELENDRYLGEGVADAAGDELHRQQIKLAPELHRRTYRIPRPDADAVCAACHVVILPGNLSVDGKDHLVADHYLSFVDSPYEQAGLTCGACHQPRFLNYRDGYPMVDHHYLGSGSALPYRDPSADKHFRAVSMSFLQGIGDLSLTPDLADASDVLPVCLDTLSTVQQNWPGLSQRAPADRFANPDAGPQHRDLLRLTIDSVENAGDALRVHISTTNECVGHAFPSGGGIKAYLEAQAFDDAGQIVGQYGGLGADDEPLETTTRLGTQAVDSAGEPIRVRRFWAAAGVTYRKEIRPGETIRDEIRLPITPGTQVARVDSTWYYLRPERFRNRERGVARDIPPLAIGSSEWRAATQ